MSSQVFNQETLHHRLSSASQIQPAKKQLSTGWKIVHAVDIFAFLPVPRTDPVSTRTSIIGSFLLLALFLTYFIFSFVQFIINNVPRLNQTTQMIDTGNYTLPDVALAFFFGDPFSQTINDPNIFTITMQQITKHQDVRLNDDTIQIPLVNCTLDWIPPTGLPMLCPSGDLKPYMSGLLYATEKYSYPRFSINYCKNSPNCIAIPDLYKFTSGGRLLLYIKNSAPNEDFATGDTVSATNYTTYQFFLDPGLYLRSEVIMQKQTYTKTPNYFTRFSDQASQYLKVETSVFYLSNVTIYNNASAFQIWMRLAQDQLEVDIVYTTIIDMVSQWGAFWGVLFAGFAFVFLRFNMNRFYEKNPEWYVYFTQVTYRDRFDERLGTAQPNINKTDEVDAPIDDI